eukprot:GILK01006365.1.p1 GENE.GILK01006365.1~~GILK01006365.1.p1  ORF type:complete len:322 (+),score=46.88 GILK01006365.1:105-1070(+)
MKMKLPSIQLLLSTYLSFFTFLSAVAAQSHHGHGHATQWWAGSSVFELNVANFDEHIGGSNHVLVEFYAQWCGWCRRMAPEYETVYHTFHGDKKTRSDVLIARIDGHIHHPVSARFGINGFPTLAFFSKGSTTVKSIYDGNRVAPDIIDWVNKLAGKAESKGPEPAPESTNLDQEPVKTETKPDIPDPVESTDESSLEQEILKQLQRAIGHGIDPVRPRQVDGSLLQSIKSSITAITETQSDTKQLVQSQQLRIDQLEQELKSVRIRVGQLESAAVNSGSTIQSHHILWMVIAVVVSVVVFAVLRNLSYSAKLLPTHRLKD